MNDLVHGKHQAQHDSNLENVLSCRQKVGLRPDKKKFVFTQDHIHKKHKIWYVLKYKICRSTKYGTYRQHWTSLHYNNTNDNTDVLLTVTIVHNFFCKF